MVYFKEYILTKSNSMRKFFSIVDNFKEPAKNGKKMTVDEPLIGPFAGSWPQLDIQNVPHSWSSEGLQDPSFAARGFFLQSTLHASLTARCELDG